MSDAQRVDTVRDPEALVVTGSVTRATVKEFSMAVSRDQRNTCDRSSSY